MLPIHEHVWNTPNVSSKPRVLPIHGSYIYTRAITVFDLISQKLYGVGSVAKISSCLQVSFCCVLQVSCCVLPFHDLCHWSCRHATSFGVRILSPEIVTVVIVLRPTNSVVCKRPQPKPFAQTTGMQSLKDDLLWTCLFQVHRMCYFCILVNFPFLVRSCQMLKQLGKFLITYSQCWVIYHDASNLEPPPSTDYLITCVWATAQWKKEQEKQGLVASDKPAEPALEQIYPLSHGAAGWFYPEPVSALTELRFWRQFAEQLMPSTTRGQFAGTWKAFQILRARPAFDGIRFSFYAWGGGGVLVGFG